MKRLSAAVMGVSFVLGSGVAMASDTVTVMNVERAAFSKAPFKRQFKTLTVTDIAAADTLVNGDVETVTINTVAMGANRKAPFRRQQVEVALTDVAAMELTTGKVHRRYNPSRKPPYSGHR
jgi:hypothetical protein